MKKLAWFVTAATVATLASAQMRQMPTPTVSATKAQAAESIERRRCNGVVVSPERVAVVARVAEELVEVGFKEGELVKKGQLLYRLDDATYAASVKAIEASIAATRAKLSYAEKNFTRLETLFKKNVSSRDEMDAAEAERDALRATVMELEANLTRAKKDLEDTRITSPIDGKIGFNNFTLGNYLTPSCGTLTTIVQLDPIRVRFSISAADYLRLFGSEASARRDAVVSLKLADGSDYGVEGHVAFLDNVANRTTDTVQFYAEFANPDCRLIPQSTLTVELRKREATKCVSVVPSAIVRDAKGAYVWVLDAENKASMRRVVTGPSTEEAQMVLDGLQVGETVVSEGTHKVMPGIAVLLSGEAK